MDHHRSLYTKGPVLNFWSVYVILLLVGCMLVAVCEFYRKRQRRFHQQPTITVPEHRTEEMKKQDERRRKQVEKALRETTMTVEEEDLIPNEEEHDNDVEIGGEEMALQLPPSKKKKSDDKSDDTDRRRLVPASCAICLGSYEVGDLVTHSPSSCSHVFHYDCIQPWFDRPKNRSNAEDERSLYNCPSCRQNFWSKEEMKACQLE